MSKSVLISIRPQWCELIANGKKTIEVRKSRPKLETPFKCYIYCTNVKSMNLEQYCKIHAKTGGRVDDWNGNIIGEFVCDEFFQYSTGNIGGQTITSEEMQRQSCLTYSELSKYENSSEAKENCIYLVGLYGWHISALQIYDKPKELSEFKQCDKCPYGPIERCNEHEFSCDGTYSLSRPPRSWCYVEGLDAK